MGHLTPFAIGALRGGRKEGGRRKKLTKRSRDRGVAALVEEKGEGKGGKFPFGKGGGRILFFVS